MHMCKSNIKSGSQKTKNLMGEIQDDLAVRCKNRSIDDQEMSIYSVPSLHQALQRQHSFISPLNSHSHNMQLISSKQLLSGRPVFVARKTVVSKIRGVSSLMEVIVTN